MFDIMFSITLCFVSLYVIDEIQNKRTNTVLVRTIDCVASLTFMVGVLYMVYFASSGYVSVFN